MSFHFIEATHTYFSDGREVPGVTRCLDHSGLVDFRFVKEEILERKSRLGTEVHRVIQYFCEGDLDIDSVADEAMPYLQSWVKVQEKTAFIPSKIEHQFVARMDGLSYGMRVDLAGKFMGSEAVLDLKIGKSAWYHGVQLAGYAIGLPLGQLTTPMAKFAQRKRYVVELRPDGEMAKVIPYRNPRDFQTFYAALEITTRKMLEGKTLQPLEEAAIDGHNDHSH
jgi:hypothetical protein